MLVNIGLSKHSRCFVHCIQFLHRVACFGFAGCAHAYAHTDCTWCQAYICVEVARSAVLSVRQMLDLAMNSMQEAYRPCTTSAPRPPFRASQRVFRSSYSCNFRQTQQYRRRTWCCRAQHSTVQQQAELQEVKHKLWPKLGVISSLLINPTASRADEVTTAAGDAAQAAANATSDMPPTVTFGGSFGQYDPIIAFFFYAVIATLTVLTLGVCLLSIPSFLDNGIAVLCPACRHTDAASSYAQQQLSACL